ncbi:hypothetical protein NQT62_13925 [Limnobacter humi]|uniref:DUF1902 domain-containing protein n=1 Tax=Limnobacter humi TaxID=1778671 RepID=A0ABT1WJ47_9BURK|nr:hypothetical protein [Limnobacter humi]MCQ8897535.1 hypothetical protein [Limnobacter humi]
MLTYLLRVRLKGDTQQIRPLDPAYTLEIEQAGDADSGMARVTCRVLERTLLSAMAKVKDDLRLQLPGMQLVEFESCKREYPPLR